MSFSQIKGHEGVVQAFTGAIARGRLAHAYLFTGPSGIGKRLFAVELAKALLCESPPEGRFDSCGKCHACLLMEAGTHPDFFTAKRPDDRQEFVIAVMHELLENLSMKPARGSRKIAVIDDADDFNEESANCFLKTLEEPPPGSLLILIGTHAEYQLATIRSRCQLVKFAPLSQQQVREVLEGDPDIDPGAVERLSILSDGSPGLAKELADEALWSFRQECLQAIAEPNPDTPKLAKAMQELIEYVGKDSGAQRRRASLLVRLVIDGLQQALRLALGRPPSFRDPQFDKVLQTLVHRIGENGLLDRLDRCLQADMLIDRRVQLVLVIEGLIDALGYGAPLGKI